MRLLLGTLAPPPAPVDDEVVFSVELDGTLYSLAHRQAPECPEPVRLSAREREIARLISAGHTTKTVAAVLDISTWTVDTHIRRIFAKLGVRSRSAMVAQLAELRLSEQVVRGEASGRTKSAELRESQRAARADTPSRRNS